MFEECQVGHALVDPRVVGSFRGAWETAFGRTKTTNGKGTAVALSTITTDATVGNLAAAKLGGILPQALKDCEWTKPAAPETPGATPNCTHVESHAGSGNARKTAFEDFKKNTSNKCN